MKKLTFTFEQMPELMGLLIERMEQLEHLIATKGESGKSSSDRILLAPEAAAMLNISVPTLYGKVHFREIPFSKKGRLYFSEAELNNWIKSGRKKTNAEIANDAEIYCDGGKRKGPNS